MEKKSKTWKRELGFLFVMLLVLVAFNGDVEMAKVLAWPTFMFNAFAHGMKGWENGFSFKSPH